MCPLNRYLWKYAAAVSLGALCALQPVLASASSSSVDTLREVRSNFARMETAAQSVKLYRQALKDLQNAKLDFAEAQRELEEAKADTTTAKTELEDAKKALAEAERNLQEFRSELTQLQQELAKKNQALKEAQQAESDFAPVLADAQSGFQQAQSRESALGIERTKEAPAWSDTDKAAAIARALSDADYAQERLEEVQARIDGINGSSGGSGNDVLDSAASAAVDEAQSAMDDASARMEELRDLRQDAEQEQAEVCRDISETKEFLAEGENEYKTAKENLAQAETSGGDAATNLKAAEASSEEAKRELAAAQKGADNFGDGQSLSVSQEYYSWKGNGTHGHQLYTSLDFTRTNNNVDIGVSTGIVSSHTGLENGSFSGITDTTLSGGYTNHHKVNDVRYGLDVNLPTGQSRIYDNSVVLDDLAAVTRPGEGWNWTPNLRVTHHINETDSWSAMAGYGFRGSYAYTKDTDGATISPGSLLTLETEYLHAAEKEQLLATLGYTHAGSTRENGIDYTDGDNLNLGVYYNRAISSRDAVQLYYLYSHAGSTDYVQPQDVPNDVVGRHYCGAGVSHQLSKKGTLRFMLNFMRANGSSYDPLRQTYINNRRRRGLLFGYDYQISERDKLQFFVERYLLKDDTAGDYNGFNISLAYELGI